MRGKKVQQHEYMGSGRAAEATQALPGSEDKIRVLEARVASHQALTAAGDLRTDQDERRGLEGRISLNHKPVKTGLTLDDWQPPTPQGCQPCHPLPLSFGTRLRFLRKRRAYSVDALARASGVSARTIQRTERNRSTPTLPTIVALALALHVTLQALAEG